MISGLRTLAAVGLRREAAILRAPGVLALASGGRGEAFAAELAEALRGAGPAAPGSPPLPPPSAVLSFGLAGALDPDLAPGDLVLGEAVRFEDETYATDPAWLERLRARLPGARVGLVLASRGMVADAALKRALARETGALAVDMESGWAARAARDAGAPLMVLRAVSDAADRSLPEAAKAGMSASGGMDALAVARALLRRPGEIPDLLRLAREAEAGFGALLRCRRRLGPALGLADV